MDSSIHSGGPIGYSSMSIFMKEIGDNYELNLDWKFPVGEGMQLFAVKELQFVN